MELAREVRIAVSPESIGREGFANYSYLMDLIAFRKNRSKINL